MIKCKECNEYVAKDMRGFLAHLRFKHKMKRQEYEEKHGVIVIEKEESVEVEEPKEVVEEKSMEERKDIIDPKIDSDNEPMIPKILSYDLVPEERQISAVFYTEDGVIQRFKQIIAIGDVEIGENKVVAALVLDDDGILFPSFVLPNFSRIVEGVQQEDKKVIKKKKKFGFGRKKSKTKDDSSDPYFSSQELIIRFSNYLKEAKK